MPACTTEKFVVAHRETACRWRMQVSKLARPGFSSDSVGVQMVRQALRFTRSPALHVLLGQSNRPVHVVMAFAFVLP